MRRRALLVLAALCLAGSAGAQRLWDMAGREFWVAFEENEGTPNGAFRLYLISPYSSWVTVAATNSAYRRALHLVPDVMQEVVLPDDLHLVGSELTDNRTVHVTATNDISCLALNSFPNSSDAFLCVPVQMLDTGYTIFSYPANLRTTSSTPSQFAVIATTNNTRVTIAPTAQTVRHAANQPFTVTLQRGQVYQVQSQTPLFGSGVYDLSGTGVVASAPVGVVSGHKRANVPYGSYSSRDILCEYLIPPAAYDTSFIVPPHAIGRQLNTVFRVIATKNGTFVRINGAAAQLLQAGQLIELPLTGVNRVTATAPVVVGSIEQTNQSGSGVTDDDPFAMLLASTPRYRRSYRIATPTTTNFVEHIMNFVVPSGATNSLRVDGSIPAVTWGAVPGTGYSWGTLTNMPAGGHVVQCDSAFGLSVYGVGNFDSYGTIGGAGVVRTAADTVAPVIVSAPSGCDTINVLVTDDSILNTGIDSIALDTVLSRNVAAVIPAFNRGVDSVRVTLVPSGATAVAVLVARDREGNMTADTLWWPAVRAVQGAGVPRDSLAFSEAACDTIVLRNLGSAAETVTSLSIGATGAFTILPLVPLPYTLRPHTDSLPAIVCYDGSTYAQTAAVTVATFNCPDAIAMIVSGDVIDPCRPLLVRQPGPVLTVSPNPVTGGALGVLLSANVLADARWLYVTLTDIFGRRVAERGAVVGEKCILPVEALPSGVYMCTVRGRIGTEVARVVIAR